MSQTIEYYLSKGFDLKSAKYFSAGRRTIKSVIPNDNFTLTITFDNDENRIYDVRPFFKKGTSFEFLSDINNFYRVYLDEQHCISWDIDPHIDSGKVWNNKIDLCPDICYMDSQPI